MRHARLCHRSSMRAVRTHFSGRPRPSSGKKRNPGPNPCQWHLLRRYKSDHVRYNLPKKIHSNASAIIGQKWVKGGDGQPRHGRELFCAKLASDLQRTLALDSDIATTYEILTASGERVAALRTSDYIKSGDSYFSPAAADARMWILGPLTACARAWHQYRSALGQHLFEHAESPYSLTMSVLAEKSGIIFSAMLPRR